MPRLLRTWEAGEYLDCSAWLVRKLVAAGELPTVRIGDGRWIRLDVRDLDLFIERHKRT
jgi:excisionase family DNA binding protein